MCCWPLVLAGLVGAFTLGMRNAALAVTVAYWRFEGEEDIAPANGDWLRPTNGRTGIEADPATGPKFITGVDVSGNGNHLYGWNDGDTGHNYRPNAVNKTGANVPGANNWQIQNNGAFPSAQTWSTRSNPTGINLDTHIFPQFTFELTVKPSTVDGVFRTFLGREGNGVISGGDQNKAPLYFQITNNNVWRIDYTDEAGMNHVATGDAQVIANQTYHLAAVMNGEELQLYVDQTNGQGFQLQSYANTPAISPNPALTYDDAGSTTAGDTVWGWTVGRGRYGASDLQGDNHTNRFLGFVDEVRISDKALDPAEFLFAEQNAPPGAHVQVNRVTGEIKLVNLQRSLRVTGYTINSSNGALDQTKWQTITGRLDALGTEAVKFDLDDLWDFNGPQSATVASEISTGGGAHDGGGLGTTAGAGNLSSITLGAPGAWIKNPAENITASILIDDPVADFTYPLPVIYTSNSGWAYRRGDLNFDNSINSADYVIFRTNHRKAIAPSLTDAQSYRFGDFDGDQDNDFNDFLTFQADYNAANGEAAFQTMVASIPEPATAFLAAIGLGLGVRRPQRRSRPRNEVGI